MDHTIKFIWEYYGKPAARTAEHHNIHLKEFVEARELQDAISGFKIISEKKAIVFLMLKEKDALAMRDILRPEKAFVVDS